MKKFLFFFICVIISLNNFAYADDIPALDDLEDYSFSEVSSFSSNEPITNSKNIVAIDRKTLNILYEKDAFKKVAMASTTKIMTCIIALEKCSKSDIVTISKNSASVTGSTLGLISNMKISMNDLLYGLMLRSGNDCAVAIAEYISGSVEEFSNLMNKKAQELNLSNTHFVTPHGLDNPEHYTTSYDLAILTDYALKNEQFRQIVSTKTTTISFNGYPKTISNTNELLGNVDGVYGVKTGFTFDAGRCLVTSCKRGNLDVIIVVLGADTKKIRTQDSSNLINFIFNNYKYVNISSSIDEAFSKYISFLNDNLYLEKTTTKPILKLEKLENYEFPFLNNSPIELNTKIYIIDKFTPNIMVNSKVGSLYLYNGNILICNVDIFIDNQLIKNDWKYYFKCILENLPNNF